MEFPSFSLFDALDVGHSYAPGEAPTMTERILQYLAAYQLSVEILLLIPLGLFIFFLRRYVIRLRIRQEAALRIAEEEERRALKAELARRRRAAFGDGLEGVGGPVEQEA